MLTLFVSCSASNYSVYTKETASITDSAHHILDRPSDLSAVVENKQIQGEATFTRVLIFTFGDHENGPLSTFAKVANKAILGKQTTASTTAAGRAIDSAKADGIFITNVVEQSTGIPILFSTTKTIVYGKPVYFKSNGLWNDQRTDRSIKEEIAALDEEIQLYKGLLLKSSKPTVLEPETLVNIPDKGRKK